MLALFITKREKNIEDGWIIQESSEHGPFPRLNNNKLEEKKSLVSSNESTEMESHQYERQFHLFSINETSSNTITRVISDPTKESPSPSLSVVATTYSNPVETSLAMEDSSRLQRLIDSHSDDPNIYLLRLKDFLQTQSDSPPSSQYLEETSLSAIWERQRKSILYSCPKYVRSYMFCQRHWIVTWNSDNQKFAHYSEQPGNHLLFPADV